MSSDPTEVLIKSKPFFGFERPMMKSVSSEPQGFSGSSSGHHDVNYFLRDPFSVLI